MPEPFKNLFSPALIRRMADVLHARSSDFDRRGFIGSASKGLDRLELKQRSAQITTALETHLPSDFEAAAALLVASLDPVEGEAGEGTGLTGWAVMPMADYVARNGLHHFETSMAALREMTKRLTAEFAIRPFLIAAPKRTLVRMKRWTRDPDRHVRRLVSEGSRPRLPWAMRIPAFIADPAPILPLLEALKDDPEDYVRRSVANNLNDIAKDHPDIVIATVRRWLPGAGPERHRLIRRACRTLVKKGHPELLGLLGFEPPKLTLEGFAILTPRVTFGGHLRFDLRLRSTGSAPQKLVLDYAIHHRKAHGGTTPKVFKWATVTLGAGEPFDRKRDHAIRAITTRVYYPGLHRVEILVNGTPVASGEFDLVMS